MVGPDVHLTFELGILLFCYSHIQKIFEFSLSGSNVSEQDSYIVSAHKELTF